LPAGILVASGNGVGENREGNGTEAGEAGERLLFLGVRGTPLALNPLESANGSKDVACFGFFAAGNGDRRRR
jgi:hypothetical protein